MSYTLSDDAKAWLANPDGSARLVNLFVIWKKIHYGGTYDDLSDRVVRWGKMSGESTLVSRNWRIPGMNPLLRNDDGYFSVNNTDSYWYDGADVPPDQCAIGVSMMFHRQGRAFETLRVYHGRIVDIVYRYNRGMAVAEFVSTMIQDKHLDRDLSKNFKMVTVPNGDW